MTARRLARGVLIGVFLGAWVCGAGAGWAHEPPVPQTVPQKDQRLARARQAMASGRFAEAAPLYVAVLADEPDQVEALSGAADALVAMGRWQEAMPYLKRLIRLRPDDATRLTQYGEMRGWQPGGRDEALVALRRAVELRPDDVRAMTALAVLLMSVPADRTEATSLFERALDVSPRNVTVLVPFAEMLSWSSGTRGRARELFEQALQMDPSNLRARGALAELDSWSGRTGAALDGFAAVLAADPANVAALRGVANVRAWSGEFIEARDLALEALTYNPTDPYALLTLARADIGLGRNREALDVLKKLPPGANYEGLDEIRGDALRGSSLWAEAGFSWRDDRSGLTVDRPAVTASSPVGGRGSVSVWYNPTFFRGPQGNFDSNRLGVAFDTRNDAWRVHAEADAERYGTTGPTAADGAFELGYRGRGPITVSAGFRREAVEDTRVSTKGADIGGEFVGQVRSNLAYASVGYASIRSHIDATAKVGGGAYTGYGLDANRRWSASGNVGVTLNGSRPYVRIGYAVDYLSFAFDASAQPFAPGQRRAGGYFSPTKFFTNFAIGKVGYRLGHDRGEVFAESSVGTQNVETTYGRFGDVGFAGTFATGVVWRPGPRNEVRAEYRFLNVFNAFRRNTAAIAYRRYF
jgi:tetratricopeptide (TPR) repeat protein